MKNAITHPLTALNLYIDAHPTHNDIPHPADAIPTLQ